MHKYRYFHYWHRTIGIFIALVVIILVVTGILLNHTDRFRLDKIYIQNSLLLNYYDIGLKTEPLGFKAGGHWISQLGTRVYFDGEEVQGNVKHLAGAVQIDDMIIVAVDAELSVFTEQTELVERLTAAEGVPGQIEKIANANGQLILRVAAFDYRVDVDELVWQPVEEREIQWPAAERLPDALKQKLLAAYQGTGLKLERVVLDFHSGRILGPWGIYLLDIMGLCMLALVLSGVWMWWKLRNRQ